LSTSVIEPGTRLAGRFRLDDRVSEAGGSTFWKATDEILARPVAVLTFAPGFPRVHDVVTAARAASRLTDPRLTQVFDADDSGERAYVVSEWVTGETLEDLLAEGAMEPDRAAAFLLEAAEALTSAHSAGLAHLCLTPHNLVWTSGGTTKVTGLGVEAVLAGTTSDSPALDDTQGLGHMLYAALTGHWCGPEGTVLPTAPAGSDGRPLSPGQLRAGVPHNLDAIVCRALQLPLRGAQEPLNAPAAFADALAKVPRSPLPFVPLMGSTPPAVVPRPEADHTATMSPHTDSLSRTVPDPTSPSRPARQPAARRSSSDREGGIGKPVIAAIVVGLVLLVALGGWGLSQMGGSSAKPKTGALTTPVTRKSSAKLSVQTARGYDPTPNQHPDTALPAGGKKAIDSSPTTYWGTQHYTDARYGHLKAGLGLQLDMGKSVTVDRVQVTMPGASPGGTVELRIGDSGGASMSRTDSGSASGSFKLDGKQAKGRYILLWFPKLPRVGSEYRIRVNNVEVFGTS
jgi:serine/threonine protein kinase